jgi:hypothetical protein
MQFIFEAIFISLVCQPSQQKAKACNSSHFIALV